MNITRDQFLFHLPDPPERDHATHNTQAAQVWTAFHARAPIRVPVRITCNTRMLVCNRAYNPRGISYQDIFSDPDLLWQTYLEFQYWWRHFPRTDLPSGIPEVWPMAIEGQNVFEAAWFGAPVVFHEYGEPSTQALLQDDHKHQLFDRGRPDPLRDHGWMERSLRTWELFQEKAQHDTFLGHPVSAPCPVGLSSDGPFTVAAMLRGADGLMIDMLTDTDYFHQLMRFITEASAARIQALRPLAGLPIQESRFCLADDSIAMLSVAQYREYVLPYHQQLKAQLAPNAPAWVHLCGDATHLFKTIRDELGAVEFDTGYPVDFAKLRNELGPDVTISGGPPVDLFMRASPELLLARTREILACGIRTGGRFILQEGNNLPPGTPEAHVTQFYELARQLGAYPGLS